MINVNIISKVEIAPIEEETIKNLIIADIQASNPSVTVNSIEFEVKRGPTRITAIVDAQLGGVKSEPVKEPVNEEPTFVEEKEVEQVPFTEDEPVEEETPLVVEGSEEAVDDTQPQSIADLFGQ